MFMLLSEQATGNPHSPYGRPDSRGHHIGDPWFRFSMLLVSRVANLDFLKPDFEILAFCEHFFKKSQTKSGFFWPFCSRKGLALEKHCRTAYSLKISSEKSL